MKEIPNKSFTETDSTAALLQVCLNFPPQGGFDLATIRARSKVADVVEKAKLGDMIELEDADFATAQDAIKQVRWGKPDKYLIQFAEQFGL